MAVPQSRANTVKRRLVTLMHRHVVNPVARRLVGHMRGQALLETTGRKSGLTRRTPVGGSLEDGSFWLVSEHGMAANYTRNMQADPRVRLQVNSRWYTGTAHLLPQDPPLRRLHRLPRINSLMVRAMGTDLLTVRVDLDGPADGAAGRGS